MECKRCGGTERYATGECKACTRARSVAWRAANPEKVRAYNNAWHAANPEKIHAYDKAWRAANPEKVRAYNNAWHAANPEKNRTRALRYVRKRRGGRNLDELNFIFFQLSEKVNQ